MEAVRNLMLFNDEMPTLRTAAAQRVLRILDDASPNLCTTLMVRNSQVERELLDLQVNHEKLIDRLRRRKNRAFEAMHQLTYISLKLRQIAEKLDEGRVSGVNEQVLHYARSELTTLSELDHARVVLQQYIDLTEVISQNI